MSRAAMTAAKLAREVQCDADEVLIRLWDVGISVPNAGCVIPRSKLALARRTLELGRPRSRSDRLAARDGRAGQDRAAAAPTSTELDVTPDPHKAKIRKPKGKLKTADGGFRWELIGRLEPVRFLSEEELNSIHWAIVHDFKKDRDPIAPPGIRDLTLFGSAVFRPQTSLQGFAKYPSVAMAGAALFHAIVHNHPFHNGNKRTALVALIAFLDYNGWVLVAQDDELFAYVLALAKHDVVKPDVLATPHAADAEVLAAARWIRRHSRKVKKGEFLLPFHRLRGILTGFGCTFEIRSGNRVYITRGALSSHVFYSSDGMEVEINSVHKIRRELELDEAHGLDSQVFYNQESRFPAFIHRYRKILERLGEYDRTEEPTIA